MSHAHRARASLPVLSAPSHHEFPCVDDAHKARIIFPGSVDQVAEKNEPIRVGLIGLGVMGQHHLRVLSSLPSAQLAFLYDQDLMRSRVLSEQYQVPSIEALLPAVSEVDAVIIATPAHTHSMLFFAVAPYVTSVFIEKPFATSVDEACQMRQVADQYNLQVQVGLIERFNPVFLALKQLSPQEILHLDFVRTNRVPSRHIDIDVIFDLMIHDLDLATQLYGPARCLHAQGQSQDGLISVASATLMHENGCSSRCLASRMTSMRAAQVKVTTAHEMIYGDLLHRTLSRPALRLEEEEQRSNPLQRELQSFIHLCQRNPVRVPRLEESVNILTLCEQIVGQILPRG